MRKEYFLQTLIVLTLKQMCGKQHNEVSVVPGGATKYSSTVCFASPSSSSAQSPSVTVSSLRYKALRGRNTTTLGKVTPKTLLVYNDDIQGYLSSRTESIGSTPDVSTRWSWSANRMAFSRQVRPCLVRKSTKASRSSLSTRSAGTTAGCETTLFY